MSHSTVAHKWFHQLGNKRTGFNSFQSGNMFYNQKIIYSYGYHFALAIRFDNLVLFNSKAYSSSTSIHQSHTIGAIDSSTHEILSAPLIDASYFNKDVKQKDAYKYIDFNYFVRESKENIKKLGNARKPEIYTNNIEGLKNKLEKVFSTFRGSKTYALKTKGIRKLLSFEFTPEAKEKMLAKRKIELEKERKRKEARKIQNMVSLTNWEDGHGYLSNHTIRDLNLNTVICVKEDKIETSKGIKIDLSEGLRVFNLWKNGKALGVTISTLGGTWSCTKVNGTIKFGCHVIDFKQAERVLTPYL